MQQLGTAVVHLLPMATSYMAAQSAEITPRSLGCSFLSPTAVSGNFGNSGATSWLRMEGMCPLRARLSQPRAIRGSPRPANCQNRRLKLSTIRGALQRVSDAGQPLAPERSGLVCRVRDAEGCVQCRDRWLLGISSSSLIALSFPLFLTWLVQ
jgi:hypothetical protein